MPSSDEPFHSRAITADVAEQDAAVFREAVALYGADTPMPNIVVKSEWANGAMISRIAAVSSSRRPSLRRRCRGCPPIGEPGANQAADQAVRQRVQLIATGPAHRNRNNPWHSSVRGAPSTMVTGLTDSLLGLIGLGDQRKYRRDDDGDRCAQKASTRVEWLQLPPV
jgi:hypothetical protein